MNDALTTPITTAIILAGIRFTDDVARMRAYLEALGLSAGITRSTTQPDWAAMHAGAGQVLLHSADTSEHGMPSGTTLLTGETPDVTELSGILEQRGLSTTVIDEAYARSLEVTDPLGAVVVVNESQTDTYGYETQRPEPDPGVEVVLSRFTDPTGPYVGFARALGLRPRGEASDRYAAYSALSSLTITPIDHPSETIWCIVTSNTCCASPSRISRPRISGPWSRSKGACAGLLHAEVPR